MLEIHLEVLKGGKLQLHRASALRTAEEKNRADEEDEERVWSLLLPGDVAGEAVSRLNPGRRSRHSSALTLPLSAGAASE